MRIELAMKTGDPCRNRPRLTALIFIAVLLSARLIPLRSEIPKFQPTTNSFPNVRNGSLAWADFDNDGDLDLIITGDPDSPPNNALPVTKLFRNDGGRFVDTDMRLPIARGSYAYWGDFDNDGFIDLLLTGNADSGARILRNLGGTNFALFTTLPTVYDGRAEWGDYNQDGFLDAAITSDDSIPRLFLNHGGKTFTESTLSRDLYYGTVDWADYDWDGDLDLLLTGETHGSNFGAFLYVNNGDTLSVNRQLIRASAVGGQWFDADNDGWPDLLITAHSMAKSYVFRNNRANDFEQISQLTVLGATAVGDADNDGFNDILILGYRYSQGIGNFVYDVTSFFQNTGSKSWAERSNLFANLSGGSAAFGDFDNDGRLDLVIQGQRGSPLPSYLTKLYRNVVERTNHPPSEPSMLKALPDGNRMRLSWDPSTDDEQSGGLTYNVRIGTEPGAGDIVHPMSAANGYRRIVKRGNAEGRSNFFIRDLPAGRTYFWSVQAVDNAFAGSSFAKESSFYVNYAPVVTAVTNLTIREDEPAEFCATITDVDSLSSQLQLTAEASNQTLLPQSGVQIFREGESWRIRVQPGPDQNGTNTLVLRATDETGRFGIASVTIQVLPVNDRPVALSRAFQILEDTSLPMLLTGFDVDGDLLRIVISQPPIHGTLEGEGAFVIYRPESNYFGIDRFSFAANDLVTTSLSATVEITIQPVVDVPSPTLQTVLRADGHFELRFHGEPREMYRIESSTNLMIWHEDIISQSPSGEIWINDRADQPYRFFRLLPIL